MKNRETWRRKHERKSGSTVSGDEVVGTTPKSQPMRETPKCIPIKTSLREPREDRDQTSPGWKKTSAERVAAESAHPEHEEAVQAGKERVTQCNVRAGTQETPHCRTWDGRPCANGRGAAALPRTGNEQQLAGATHPTGAEIQTPVVVVVRGHRALPPHSGQCEAVPRSLQS